MASALSTQERLDAFSKSLHEWEILKQSRPPPFKLLVHPPEEEVAAAREAIDDFWKEEPEPEAEKEEDDRESLRLQQKFFEEKGYKWVAEEI